jgi:hypothetical protein
VEFLPDSGHAVPSVLHLARTGTVVSSPCNRSAAKTCASIRLRIGSSSRENPSRSAMRPTARRAAATSSAVRPPWNSAAVGLDDEKLHIAQQLLEPRLEVVEIGVHHGRQIAVHHRGRGALVLAVFRADRVRQADCDARQSPGQDRAGAALVLGIEEREQEADRHRPR